MASFHYTKPEQRLCRRTRADRINRAVYSVCALCAVGALIGVLMLAYVVGYGL